MSRIVFLLEEYSMKVFIEGFIPRLFPELDFLCIHHEGKNDLERSIPRKLRAWRDLRDRFIIIRDNDGSNCQTLKSRIMGLCPNHVQDRVRVRIVCQELEAWYFGDLQALSEAYDRHQLSDIGRRRRYRDPDSIIQPSIEIVRLIPEFQKVSGARLMAPLISSTRNKSKSFQVLIQGVGEISDPT